MERTKIHRIAIQDRDKMTDKEQKPAGSHHGIPDLLSRDIALLEAHAKWVQTVRKAKTDRKDWLPHHPDWIKSRLFWRIRSGKEPLEFAPPTCFSCPWYEVVEEAGPHGTHDDVRVFRDGENYASVAQCKYAIISGSLSDKNLVLGFGPYRFMAWNDVRKTSDVDGRELSYPCGMIQRAKDLETNDPH